MRCANSISVAKAATVPALETHTRSRAGARSCNGRSCSISNNGTTFSREKGTRSPTRLTQRTIIPGSQHSFRASCSRLEAYPNRLTPDPLLLTSALPSWKARNLTCLSKHGPGLDTKVLASANATFLPIYENFHASLDVGTARRMACNVV
jgi:hypothetical protein